MWAWVVLGVLLVAVPLLAAYAVELEERQRLRDVEAQMRAASELFVRLNGRRVLDAAMRDPDDEGWPEPNEEMRRMRADYVRVREAREAAFHAWTRRSVDGEDVDAGEPWRAGE